MYQSIYYDFETYTYYLRDDEKGWLQFKYQPTYWKRVSKPQENAQPVLTGGWAIPTKKFSKDFSLDSLITRPNKYVLDFLKENIESIIKNPNFEYFYNPNIFVIAFCNGIVDGKTGSLSLS